VRAALLLFDAPTGRHLARAIADYRLRHDDVPEALEHIEWLVLEASRDDGSGHRRPETDTSPAARHDERVPADWLTHQQAADQAGVSTRTIRRWIKGGLLTSHGPGHNKRIHRDAIAELMGAAR
jgi:excisionase family DNA binding protein